MKILTGLALVFLPIIFQTATAGNYSWKPIERVSTNSIEASLDFGSHDSLRTTSIGDYNINVFENYEIRITPVINVPADRIAFLDWAPNNYNEISGITLRNLYIQNAQFGIGIMQLSRADDLIGLIMDPNDKYAWDATDPLLVHPLGIPAAYYRYQFDSGLSLTGRYAYAAWSKISNQTLPEDTRENSPHGGTGSSFELIGEIKYENQTLTLYAARTNSPWPIDAGNDPKKNNPTPREFEPDVFNQYNLGMQWDFKTTAWDATLKAGGYYAEENVDSKILIIPCLKRNFSMFEDQARIGIGYFYSHSLSDGTAHLQNHFDPRLWLNDSVILTFQMPIKICTILSEFLYDPIGDKVMIGSTISIPIITEIALTAKIIYINGFEDLRDTNEIAVSIGISSKF